MPDEAFVPPTDLVEAGERMLQILDERGWHQGSLRNHTTGAVCVQGALRYAVIGEICRPSFIGSDLYQEAFDALDACARQEGFECSDRGCPSVTFNDDKFTTEEDIRLFIKRALMNEGRQ